MIASKAQSKRNEIVNFLNSHTGLIDHEKLDFIRWLRDAKALIKNDPIEGYLMEGLVYRAQGKLDLAVNSIRRAYRLDRFVAGHNYVSILAMNGDYIESEEITLELIAADRADSQLMFHLASNVIHTLNKNNLAKAIELFRPTNPAAEKLLEGAKGMISSIDDIALKLEKSNVSFETYINYWRLASKVRNKFYNGSSSISVKQQYNEIGSFLIIKEELFDVSIEDCLELNDSLIEAVIEDDYSFDEYQKIVFNFAPAIRKTDAEVLEA